MQSLIASGAVFVNDVIVTDVNFYLSKKDLIVINDDTTNRKIEITPDQNVKFSILYEDNDLLVINKPAGVVVHPGAGNFSNTLVNGLVFHCGSSLSKLSDEYRPGIVHRIDKDTSGVLVVAKNDAAHAALAEQFVVHSIKRKYVAFCFSIISRSNGTVETLIARDPKNRLKMAVSKQSGKNAITIYRTIRTFGNFASKIECELKTGRTHQIRVHLSNMGNSIIGDSLYKTKNYSLPKDIAIYVNNFNRQALHAYFLEFAHPTTKKSMRFEIEMPEDMQNLEKTLSKYTERSAL